MVADGPRQVQVPICPEDATFSSCILAESLELDKFPSLFSGQLLVEEHESKTERISDQIELWWRSCLAAGTGAIR